MGLMPTQLYFIVFHFNLNCVDAIGIICDMDNLLNVFRIKINHPHKGTILKYIYVYHTHQGTILKFYIFKKLLGILILIQKRFG